MEKAFINVKYRGIVLKTNYLYHWELLLLRTQEHTRAGTYLTLDPLEKKDKQYDYALNWKGKCISFEVITSFKSQNFIEKKMNVHRSV